MLNSGNLLEDLAKTHGFGIMPFVSGLVRRAQAGENKEDISLSNVEDECDWITWLRMVVSPFQGFVFNYAEMDENQRQLRKFGLPDQEVMMITPNCVVSASTNQIRSVRKDWGHVFTNLPVIEADEGAARVTSDFLDNSVSFLFYANAERALHIVSARTGAKAFSNETTAEYAMCVLKGLKRRHEEGFGIKSDAFLAVSVVKGEIWSHNAAECFLIFESQSSLSEQLKRSRRLTQNRLTDQVASLVRCAKLAGIDASKSVTEDTRSFLRSVPRDPALFDLICNPSPKDMVNPRKMQQIVNELAIEASLGESIDLGIWEDKNVAPDSSMPSPADGLADEEAAPIEVPEGKPVWYGQFWRDEEPVFFHRERSVVAGALCIKGLSNLPYDEVILETLKLAPDAEPLLMRWRAIWDKSFPGWQLNPEWHFDMSEKPQPECYLNRIGKAFNWVRSSRVKETDAIATLDTWVSNVGEDIRDYRLHVIDDADAVCSMVHLDPEMGILDAVGVTIAYTGKDADGYPMFRYAPEHRTRVEVRLADCPDYWNWPFYSKYLGRRGLVTRNATHTAAVLADMAQQGETHAFLKGTASKSGTWKVSLEGVTNMETAMQRLRSTVGRDNHGRPMYVQENLPFTHEQRFYIQGGRLFASSCSDRHFSVLNASGKRLDSRIAVLENQSGENGYFDRGITNHVMDRKTSALFARKVRQMVAEFRQYGLEDYCIDMGLTERGAVSVEVNTLHRAGPYNLRRDLYVKQFVRTAKLVNLKIKSAVLEMIANARMPPAIRSLAVDFVTKSNNIALMVPMMERYGSTTKKAEIAALTLKILFLAVLAEAGVSSQNMKDAA